MEKAQSRKLVAKFFIEGIIRVKTGLHIGGDTSSLDIGAIDLNVIKDENGNPYIPGSSLKGKLRSMLAKITGSMNVDDDLANSQKLDGVDITGLFGHPGKGKGETTDSEDQTNFEGDITRLQVRDAFVKFDTKETNTHYVETEIKWENTINRLVGTAEHPRQLERVPPNTQFAFTFVYDCYDDALPTDGSSRDYYHHIKAITTAMRLLQDDYLGGSGTRGYGNIDFENVALKIRPIAYYQTISIEKRQTLETPFNSSLLEKLPSADEITKALHKND